jgi:hypothetical protein
MNQKANATRASIFSAGAKLKTAAKRKVWRDLRYPKGPLVKFQQLHLHPRRRRAFSVFSFYDFRQRAVCGKTKLRRTGLGHVLTRSRLFELPFRSIYFDAAPAIFSVLQLFQPERESQTGWHTCFSKNKKGLSRTQTHRQILALVP